MTAAHFILTITCPDTVGVVAAVSTFLTRHGAFITESSHYGDPDTGRFFMRTVFRAAEAGQGAEKGQPFAGIGQLRHDLAQIASQFNMEAQLVDSAARPKTVIAVSKFGHCLNHLLHLWHSEELPIDIVAVVSNHEDFRRLVDWYGVPYHHLPVTGNDKAAQAEALHRACDQAQADLVVLARYMQILPESLCEAWSGRCINIHHSFLPSFKGARPYHQAHARGVKVIGATAHYVTTELDEGPIIEQQTAPVDHSFTAEALTRVGKEIESAVLARAVRWHAERRVLLNGRRTVVLKHGG